MYNKNIREESQGNLYRGELNGTAKINEAKALEIIKLLEEDKRPIARIAREENISENILRDINRCKT